MRLTCPNCDAKYEVPDEVIPAAGRDVQCSNCGQTWFQHHADHMPEDDEDEVELAAPAPDEEIAPPPPPPQPTPRPERRELDPAVADILREEAEAEQQARRAARPRDAIETQPDLGLDEADLDEATDHQFDEDDEDDHRTEETRARMARLRGEPPPVTEAAATAAAVGSRRDLLPDIDEINSTLRSDSERVPGMAEHEAGIEAPSHQREKRGFRRGFMIILLIFILLIALYIFAPQLAEAVPAMDPWLNSYVAKVDQWRLMLNEQLQGLLIWLDAAASKSEAGN